MMRINDIEDIESPGPHKVGWFPLMLSVLLHAGVIGLLSFRSVVPPSVEIQDDVAPGLRVQLIKINVPSPPRPNAQEQPVVESIADVIPDTAANETATDPNPAEPADEPLAPPEDVQTPETVAENDPLSGDAPRQELSGEQLEASINTYMSSYKSDIQQSWVEECVKYQNRHGVQDCATSADTSYAANREQQEQVAQLFENYVTRATDNQRYSRQLLAESEYLRSLMDDESVLGQLARQQYYLTKARYCYISGCTGSGFTAPQGDVVVIINLVSLVLRLAGKDPAPPGLNMAEGQYRLPESPAAEDGFPIFGTSNSENSQEPDTFKVSPPLFPLR